MRVANIFGITLALTAGIGGVADQLAQAIQLRDGTVYFAQPPYLIGASATYNSTGVWGAATYYFTLNVPPNAGEPLQRVTIAQREGAYNIRFNLESSRAFVGTRDRKGEPLTLGEVIRDRETKTVSVTFDPPVTPGQTVTIGLRPVRNPSVGGVYLFGVTAFPSGEKPHGQFLGFGRLQFYGGRGRFDS